MGLTPQADFNPKTPNCTNHNLIKHGCSDCEPHNLTWACTDGQTVFGTKLVYPSFLNKKVAIKKKGIPSECQNSLDLDQA